MNLFELPLLKDVLVLAPETPFTTLGILRSIEPKTSPKAGEYLRIVIGDKTGSFSVNVWNSDGLLTKNLRALKGTGDAFILKGTAAYYNNSFSPKISAMDPLPPDMAEAMAERFISVSARSVPAMQQELKAAIASLSSPELRAVVTSIVDSIGTTFLTAPAGISIHHAYRSGLLEHTLSAVGLADRLIAYYRTIPFKRDVAIAALILHDTFKVREYQQTKFATEIAPEGFFFGHIAPAFHTWMSAAEGKLPPALVAEIGHCILAHHGELEHGSPVTPHSPTAWLVHFCDLVDVRFASVANVIANQAGKAVTNRECHIDRMVLEFTPTETARPPQTPACQGIP